MGEEKAVGFFDASGRSPWPWHWPSVSVAGIHADPSRRAGCFDSVSDGLS